MGYCMRRLTDAELLRYIGVLESAPKSEAVYAAISVLCLATGARIGEILSVRLRDVVDPDTLDARERVARRVEKRRGVKIRTVYFPPQFRPIIERAAGLAVMRGVTPDGKIFKVCWKSAWRHNRGFLRRAGLPVTGIAFHGLRKTYLTRAFREKMEETGDTFASLKFVQELAGHAEFESTIKYIIADIGRSENETLATMWEKTT